MQARRVAEEPGDGGGHAKGGLFAVWSYDLFPYLQGGEVVRLLPDGRAEVRGHPGMAVEPLRLLPLAAGEALFTELGALAEDLTGRYGSDAEWLDKVYHVAPYLWRAQSLGQAGHARERAREKEDA